MKSIKFQLLTYFQKVHRQIIGKLKDWDGTLEEEWLHQLRVNLKRIRFVRSVLKRNKAFKNKKLFRHYQKLFELAGNIRAHHVSIYRIKKHTNGGEAMEAQRKYQQDSWSLHEKFSETVVRLLHSENKKSEKIKTKIERMEELTQEMFLQDLKNRVEEKLTPDLPPAQWHQSRKLLKEVVYTTELSAALKKQIAAFYHLKKIVALEDAIGDWHDLRLLLQGKGYRKISLKKASHQNLKQEYHKEKEKVKSLLSHIIKA